MIIGEHNLLSQEKHRKKFLEYCPDINTRNRVEAKWTSQKDMNGEEMWKVWCEQYDLWLQQSRDKMGSYNNSNKLSKEALVFTYLYPRLDANVSTGINHLLKSPWCVHPKTGKICVPIDPTKPNEFQVSKVPTLTECINELGQGKTTATGKEEGEVAVPQCLLPYMRHFTTFLRALEQKRIRELQKANKN